MSGKWHRVCLEQCCVWWPNDLQTMYAECISRRNISTLLSYLRFKNLNIKRRGEHERNIRLYMCSDLTTRTTQTEEIENKNNFSSYWPGQGGLPAVWSSMLHNMQLNLRIASAILSPRMKFIFRQFPKKQPRLEHFFRCSMLNVFITNQKLATYSPDIRHDILIIYFNNFISFPRILIVFSRFSKRNDRAWLEEGGEKESRLRYTWFLLTAWNILDDVDACLWNCFFSLSGLRKFMQIVFLLPDKLTRSLS